MKLLLLGAENYIGQHLLRMLETQAGFDVSAFPSLTHCAAAEAELEHFEAIVNCTIGTPELIEETASRLAVQVLRLRGQPRIVHLSSMTVYGDVTGLISETFPTKEGLSAYASAQIRAEQQIGSCANAVILRPGCEYGPGCPQWSQRVARWLKTGRIGDLGANGIGRCNLLNIDDLASAVVSAVRTPGIEGRKFNLANPDAPSWNVYFGEFSRALGYGPVRTISPLRLLVETRLLAIPLKLVEIIFQKMGSVPAWLPPAIPPSLPALGRQDIRLDVRAAETTLGIQWTPIGRGLEATAASIRTEQSRVR